MRESHNGIDKESLAESFRELNEKIDMILVIQKEIHNRVVIIEERCYESNKPTNSERILP